MRREERMANAGRFLIGRRSRWPWVGDEERMASVGRFLDRDPARGGSGMRREEGGGGGCGGRGGLGFLSARVLSRARI
jgi:hypothetical protein